MPDVNDLLVAELRLHPVADLAPVATSDALQLARTPIDSLVRAKRCVPCPRRGTHLRLADCWLYFGDVAWGYASEAAVVRPNDGATL